MMSVDISYLRNYFCFQDLIEAQLDEVAQLCEAECFYSGHTLFEDGKPGTHLYLLAKGEVEVLFAIGEEGLVLVDCLDAGKVIGCDVLVPPFTYRSTARSLDEIEVLIIDSAKFRALMQEDCKLGLSVQQHIIQILLDQIVDLQLGS